MDTALTFDQLESHAETSLAWVLWAKNAKNMVFLAAMMALVSVIIKRFIASITPERLEPLTPAQADEFKEKLQQIHGSLLILLRMRGCQALKSNLLFRFSVAGLEDRAEDLSDIIEDLILAGNPQFNKLVQDCVQALSHEPVGLSARM